MAIAATSHRPPHFTIDRFGPKTVATIGHQNVYPADVVAAGGNDVIAYVLTSVDVTITLPNGHHVHVSVVRKRPSADPSVAAFGGIGRITQRNASAIRLP